MVPPMLKPGRNAWLIGLVGAIVFAAVASGCAAAGAESSGRRTLLFSDDFHQHQRQHQPGGLDGRWVVEAERGGTVVARDGRMEIDVPAGCTVWFKPLIEGPVEIEYEVTAVAAGGANDRVSDVNCFWMARDARSPDDLFATPRSGRFAEYNQLKCYYVGLGGNGNTTTRFRRYIGDPELRPLLPEHDLAGPRHLLVANRPQKIQLVAAGHAIRFRRDGRTVFEMNDPEPYTSGWFGLRTTANHMVVRRFRVYRLTSSARGNL
jgi:hypothetical protein